MQKILKELGPKLLKIRNTSCLWNNGQKTHVLTWLEAFTVESPVLCAGIQCWYVKGQILPQRERGRTMKTILMRLPLSVVCNNSTCCYGIWEQASVAWGLSSFGTEFPECLKCVPEKTAEWWFMGMFTVQHRNTDPQAKEKALRGFSLIRALR